MPVANRHVFEWNTVPCKDGENYKEASNRAQAMTRTWDVHVWDDHVNFWLPEWMGKITGAAEGGHGH
jgi:hypothetical protein